MNLKSQLLFLGPWSMDITGLGAEVWTETQKKFVQHPDVIVVKLSEWSHYFHQIEDLLKTHHDFKIIIVSDKAEVDASVLSFFNRGLIYDFIETQSLENDQAQNLKDMILQAFELIQNLRQKKNLQQMIEEQNTTLIKTQTELEDKAQKKSKNLIESRAKLVQTNIRIENFRRSLIATYKSSSFRELESQLNKSLADTVKTSWVKIILNTEDDQFEKEIKSQLDVTFLRLGLYHGEDIFGSIFYIRPGQFKFSKEEKDLLSKVTEAVSLSMMRIQRLNDSEHLKTQWESTFNAFKEPLIMVNSNYDVLQGNLTQKTGGANKCYQLIFGREAPCEGCHLSEKFLVQDDKFQFFEVHSQKINFDGLVENTFANIYTNVTEKLLFEQKLLESARHADLGLISSSIAHEINNPLAGMLTFAQLIRMSLKNDHPLFADIAEIEFQLKKCRDIIQNLLIFARHNEAPDKDWFSLGDAIKDSINLVTLQARFYGIQIHSEVNSLLEKQIFGSKQDFNQIVTSLLQKSIKAIISKKEKYQHHKGHIDLELKQNDGGAVEIQMIDNGDPELAPSLSKPSEAILQPTLILQKLLAHFNSSLEINPSAPARFPLTVRAKISIPQAVLKS